MNDIVVRSVPGSPYGRAVLVALEEKGAPFRLVGVSPASLRQPEHQARHPFNKIPVFEHGGFRLYETQAILRYIDRVLPSPPLTPIDPRAAGRMDQMMNVCDWYLFSEISRVIGFQRVVGPRLMGAIADESAIEAVMPRALAVFSALADELADRPYFAGQELSLADILLAPHVDFFRDIPEWTPLMGPHDNLRAWIDRMCARPSMAATTWERVAALAEAA